MIILIILILLALVFTIPIKFEAAINTEGAEIKIKYLFFKFTLFPVDKSEKADKTKKKSKNKSKTPSDKNSKKQLKFLYYFKNDLVSSIKKIVNYVLSHAIIIKKLNINIKIGTGDPADTGMLCGGLYSFVYSAIGLLQASTKLKDHNVIIDPDFENTSFQAGAYALLSTRLAHIFVLLITLIRLLIKYKSAKKRYERSLNTK